MPRWFYALAADIMVVVHLAFMLYIILGEFLIVAGAIARWAWVRNAWFRWTHLGAIMIVVVETFAGMTCPLTEWEDRLRLSAGESAYEPAGFIAHWLHRCIFFTAPPWVFVMCYTLFGLAVLGTLILSPPRWRAHGDAPAARV